MKSEETIETFGQTVLKIILSALLGFSILIGVFGFAFAIFLYANALPDTSIELASVARDTTFYVGADQSQRGEGSTLSIRAVGQVDDSTATILVVYPNHPLVAIKGSLMPGLIDQLWVNDFYDRRAKITFLHKTVQHGRLRLQVHFAYPPASWGYQQTNRGWIKAK
ncbi:hypothetical protein [Spirosoma linguale]|uniref:Uncharacterized protein n=1 Tax=Spirosoma linguale (strain ATCC 33905 / DSM 74 / LMG 10896 / Claus 1) TaxID=504472 RepID=D2QUS2_SPILD|nr:hypothetical protein Slin_6597 [Spirosoma linguale DSM 74]